jgi:hypothetical protein
MLPLAQQDGIRRIQLPSQVEVLVYEGQQDEAVDLDDMAFIVDDNEVRNVGPLLNANDMSLVYDDSPQRNVGPLMDANDMSLVYDDRPQRNVCTKFSHLLTRVDPIIGGDYVLVEGFLSVCR